MFDVNPWSVYLSDNLHILRLRAVASAGVGERRER